MLACLVLSWVLRAVLGWAEFALIGWVFTAISVLSALFLAGRTNLRVTVTLHPSRVQVGERAAGRVRATNTGRRPLPPIAIELPVGESVGRFNMGALGAGGEFTDEFGVPTHRRGVVPIGPAVTVRGDPFGLLRRSASWTEQLELFVHPRLVPIAPLDAGILRDLEGQPTNDISASDLAFHALREYVPGDDRRFIHWRSSAKATAHRGGIGLQVRQFLDTRRSHLTVVVDGNAHSYAEVDEDFETAISVAASISVRAIRDGIKTTVVAGSEFTHLGGATHTLDGFARAELTKQPLGERAGFASRLAPGTSLAVLVTGAHTSFAEIRRAALHFPHEVRAVVVRVTPGERARISVMSEATVLTLATLSDLPRLLRWGAKR